MKLQSLYEKPVQVMLWENWTRNAIGILKPSPLGEDCFMLVPIPKGDPILKTLPTGSVATPLHLSIYTITGIFELTQTSGEETTAILGNLTSNNAGTAGSTSNTLA